MKKSKTFSRMLSLTLSLLLIICAIPMAVVPAVATEPDVWDGTASASLSGTGTSSDPYLIQSAKDLAYFASSVNAGKDYASKVVKLTTDLVLNANAENYESWEDTAPANEWTPIGYIGTYFRGTFLGGDHTISGLYVDTTANNGTGLFGATQNAVIKNIKVTDSFILAFDAVAGIVGFADNTYFSYCSFNGLVAANGADIKGVAGIADFCRNTCTAVCCSVSGKLYATKMGAGGIFGKNYSNTEIITLIANNCYCDAEFDYGSIENYPAGIIGVITATSAGSKVDVVNCFATNFAIRQQDSTLRRLSLVSYSVPNVSVANSYYLFDEGDNDTWLANADKGVQKSTTEFANGTVAGLLGPCFVQGDGHPVIADFELEGEGTEGSPYLINNAEDFAYLANLVNVGKVCFENEHFALTNDIVFNENAEDYATWGTTAPANTWTPIGSYSNNSPFKGTFDGGNHTISGLYVNSPDVTYAGFFGYVQDGAIKNLKITNSYIAAKSAVGGISGFARGEKFFNCSFNGTVRALNTTSNDNFAAPIAAAVDNTLSAELCYADGIVIGSSRSGGLFGAATNGITATINNCYSLVDILVKMNGNLPGSIFGFAQKGGYNANITLTNCYSKSTGYRLLVSDSTVADKYERTAGTERNIALFGDGSSDVVLNQSNCYYCKLFANGDWINNGVDSTVNLTEIQVADYATLADRLGPCFVQGDTHPVIISSYDFEGKGTYESPYLIKNADDFAYLANLVNVGKVTFEGDYFALTNDIAFNENAEDYATWGTTAPANTWTPIGVGNNFKGIFDGGNHTVSGVYVNTTNNNGGLFGTIQKATVKNLNVVDSYIVAQDFAAGLIGYAADSNVKNCSFTGLVKTKDTNGYSHAAGLIAQVLGAVNVEKCFTECKIVSGSRSAGLVGCSESSTTLAVRNSYSIVDIPIVATSNTPAGIFGFAQGSGTVTVTNCYTIGTGANPAGAARELRLVGQIHQDSQTNTGPTSTCTNSYYCQTSDSATMWGVDQGTAMAPADFTDGTVADLLGDEFIQGAEHPVFVSTLVKGDLHVDGVINILDLVVLKKYIANPSNLTYAQVYVADLDDSGNLDAQDLTAMVNIILGIPVVTARYNNNNYTLIG